MGSEGENLPFPEAAATSLGLGEPQAWIFAHGAGPGCHNGDGCCHSLPQDQEDGEHTEGGEGEPQALLLQPQAFCCHRPLQEVTAGERAAGEAEATAPHPHPRPSPAMWTYSIASSTGSEVCSQAMTVLPCASYSRTTTAPGLSSALGDRWELSHVLTPCPCPRRTCKHCSHQLALPARDEQATLLTNSLTPLPSPCLPQGPACLTVSSTTAGELTEKALQGGLGAERAGSVCRGKFKL